MTEISKKCGFKEEKALSTIDKLKNKEHYVLNSLKELFEQINLKCIGSFLAYSSNREVINKRKNKTNMLLEDIVKLTIEELLND